MSRCIKLGPLESEVWHSSESFRRHLRRSAIADARGALVGDDLVAWEVQDHDGIILAWGEVRDIIQ